MTSRLCSGSSTKRFLWLTARGLGGQWGREPWSERPETKVRVARLARSSWPHRRRSGRGSGGGALEVSEVSPTYAPAGHG